MAKTASMYIRIDPELKADVEQIYSKFGMSITDAVNIFLHQSRNVGGMPFKIRPLKKVYKPSEVKGILHRYANPDLIPEEKKAWEKAAVEKHDRIRH
jgi:addiction module RelB/DinJ family antitoxin